MNSTNLGMSNKDNYRNMEPNIDSCIEAQRKTVLIIDDTPGNIDLLRGVLSPKYNVSIAKSAEIALSVLERLHPDLILLDIMMPEMNGYELCVNLKSDPKYSGIPVIFVTAMNSAEDEAKGFEVGAVDFITKPISKDITLSRVRLHIALAEQHKRDRCMLEKRTEQLEEALESAVKMLSDAASFKDHDTEEHMWRMAEYSALLAEDIGWEKSSVEMLKLASPMHDMGKIGIPDSILTAPRKLTADEWEVMKTHPEIGHRILDRSSAPLFKMAGEIALNHHERWDGTGYPKGLVGKSIPMSARIVALADVFDSLTMRRAYKPSWPIEDAYEYIQENAGMHFDPELVERFIQLDCKIRIIKSRWDSVIDGGDEI
ncbi:HD domain-containing phosphohydrolase [Marinomonas balearica]|uniref:Putative two-component system response regulator n=1 Tax=Marinomonas balearica TaxID=491947 RepID=A0A4R6M6E7_9GAMM|nr:HD domain-containing phosphohydrolase [Marinomonas balearica]TDO96957.1 putative two-component system response regulator [Marinomonas balearica]